MASVKVKFRPSTVVGHEGIVYYQIIHERKVRQLRTEYKILASEWNENRSTVTTTLHSERKGYILSIREKIRLDIERLTKFAITVFFINFAPRWVSAIVARLVFIQFLQR